MGIPEPLQFKEKLKIARQLFINEDFDEGEDVGSSTTVDVWTVT